MLSVDLEGVGIDFPIYGAESRSLKKRLLGRRIGSRVSYGTRHVVTIHALRWTAAGANAIIALRCCLLSGRFEDFWERRAANAA